MDSSDTPPFLTNTAYCWSHHTYEDMPEDHFRVCQECFHVFPTAASLLADHRVMMTDIWKRTFRSGLCTRKDYKIGLAAASKTAVEDIASCPHCIHDW